MTTFEIFMKLFNQLKKDSPWILIVGLIVGVFMAFASYFLVRIAEKREGEKCEEDNDEQDESS